MEVKGGGRDQVRSAACPHCDTGIQFNERLLVGETLRCNACGTDLEVADPDSPSLIQRVRVEALDSERGVRR